MDNVWFVWFLRISLYKQHNAHTDPNCIISTKYSFFFHLNIRKNIKSIYIYFQKYKTKQWTDKILIFIGNLSFSLSLPLSYLTIIIKKEKLIMAMNKMCFSCKSLDVIFICFSIFLRNWTKIYLLLYDLFAFISFHTDPLFIWSQS